MTIENISDTARWVAAFRAMESERPDALFVDPFARKLAGERGFEIAAGLRGFRSMRTTMAVRTRVIDDMLRAAIAEGADLVVNLAAGLDTRPQRMDLPRTLRWVEADLPGILDHKERVLGDAPAKCQLERVRVDLAQDDARRALLQRLGAGSKHAIVLTEGLLVYLPEPAVANLARELRAQPSFRGWMMDLVDQNALRWVAWMWNAKLAEGNARLQFGAEGGANWFAPLGWRLREHHAFPEAGARLHRGIANWLWGRFGFLMLPKVREDLRNGSGLVWLEPQ